MSDPTPITTSNVTVNGNRCRETDAAWIGLEWSGAELLNWSVIGALRGKPDHHLRVPFMHPEDQARGSHEWVHYRVRPRKPWRSFVMVDGAWRVSKEKFE